MSGITIDKEKCVGCSLCVKSCASGAIRVSDGKAAVDMSKCVICNICIGACPAGAISIPRESASDKDLSSYRDIWVFAEQEDGEPAGVSLELLGKGRSLANAKGCRLAAVIGGKNAGGNARALIQHGADIVYLCRDSRLYENSEEEYSALMVSLIRQYRPEAILYGATTFGRSLAPKVAARIKTGLTADCTELDIDAETGLLRQTRPAFGGNLMATIICPDHRPQMSTVRPGIMQPIAPNPSRRGEIQEVFMAETISRVKLIETVNRAAANSIADAKFIVEVGRGIGNQKNLALAEKLAKQLGAELGCTRPLVDMGWCGYSRQIGQTGCSVAPDLLLSLGVSGAIQHLAGTARAKKVIAVNSDPDAPIFSVSTYKVVADCVEVVKQLLSLKNLR